MASHRSQPTRNQSGDDAGFQFGGDEFLRSVNAWHGLVANIIVAVALLHSAAARFHHHVIKDGVLRRMSHTMTGR